MYKKLFLLLVFIECLTGSVVFAKTSTTTSTPEDKGKYAPILMYHHIADRIKPDPYFVSPAVFEQQMAWLKTNNYHVITYRQFYDGVFGTSTLPSKPVVITFDDGDVDQYTNAFPILKKYGYSAMFYITTNYVTHPHWMNLKMLADLKNSGMEIGGHTVHHPILPKHNIMVQLRELSESKKLLEEKLNTKIDFFAYPFGSYNTSTLFLLKKLGYLSAVTVKHNVFHPTTEDPYLVHRIHIDDDLASFIQFVEGKRR